MKNLFKLSTIIKGLIFIFLFIITITPNNVFAVTNTKKVSASNGRVTVTFKYALTTTPKTTDFVVTQSINKGASKSVKSTKVTMDSTKKIATLIVPVIAKTSSIQNVVYKVSYKKDIIASSPTMVVVKAIIKSPVDSFKDYILYFLNSYSEKTIYRVANLGGGWVNTYYTVLNEYTYDVQNTNSLVSPYKGICEFTLVRHFTDFHTTEEDAKNDTVFTEIDSAIHKHSYSYSDGKWNFKSGQKYSDFLEQWFNCYDSKLRYYIDDCVRYVPN